MTHLRAAAYLQQTFNGGFPAMNLESCRSQRDPQEPFTTSADQRQETKYSRPSVSSTTECSSAVAVDQFAPDGRPQWLKTSKVVVNLRELTEDVCDRCQCGVYTPVTHFGSDAYANRIGPRRAAHEEWIG